MPKGGQATKKRPKKEKPSSTPKEPKEKESFLDREQRVEILAVGLLALSLFTFLALVPITLFGARGGEWFPDGNMFGQVGLRFDQGIALAVGIGAWCFPPLLAVSGLASGGWMSRRHALRFGLLAIGLMVLVPTGAFLLGPETGSAGPGWLGEVIGTPLHGALGFLGSMLVVSTLAVVLSVATLGWNPVRAAGDGVARGGAEVGRRVGEWRSARAEARAAQLVLMPDPALDAAPFAPESGEEIDPAVAAAAAVASVAGVASVGVPALVASPEADEKIEGKVEERAEEKDAKAARKAKSKGAAEEGAKAPKPEAAAVPSRSIAEVLLPDPADPLLLRGGKLPPLDLLSIEEGRDRHGMDRELDRLGQVLIEKLKTFNVQSEIGGRTTGPVVTQFEVIPAPGVKVNRIANLDADLALAMKAQSVRIVAPIPGKGAVGVEIPNPEAQVVGIREILEAKEYQKARGYLPLGLGKDLTGRSYVADLGKMPHLLIAGATGSGKSVCINTIITSMIYRHTAETLRLLMIDPKMVELSAYGDLPHLRHPVVTDPRDAAGVLKWAVLEMERRYQLLSMRGVRSISEFNQRVLEGPSARRARSPRPGQPPVDPFKDDNTLPYIVVVVDELADLMMTVQSEIEKPLAQLAQKARAIGIHLIVATQRPSVNVITGLIKANFPTRIAFRVASKTDSRTILDQNGAEALLGNGDMLFLPPGGSEPVRIQGAFISTGDTDDLLHWFREQAIERAAEASAGAATDLPTEPDILEEVRKYEALDAAGGDGAELMRGEWDELFRAAAEVCVQHDQGSTSLLQRRLKIGYGRAARIVDQLHEAGVLGPPDGSKPREVLVSLSELDSLFPGT